MALISLIKKDARRYHANALKGMIIGLTKLGFWAILNYRIGRSMRVTIKFPILKQAVWGISGITRMLLNIITGIDIPYSAQIGGGIKICHFGTIFISSKAVIGESFTLHQGVTIGKGGHLSETAEPVIGDDVFIGANSTVIGAIKIGNRVRIGCNVCCFKSVEDDVTVVSNGIRVIKNESRTTPQ